MKIVMVSCYLSPHQLPFSLYLHEKLGKDFCFVAVEPISEERLKLGYPDMNSRYPFVVRMYENKTQKKSAMKWIKQADVVILAGPPIQYMRPRLRQNKLILCYSERLYKRKYPNWKIRVHKLRLGWQYGFGRCKNLYMLCASAYTAGDFAKLGLFQNKAYKWGYFPELKQYDNAQQLMKKKEPNTLLWVGRFLDWKHPEYVLEVAKRLRREGYDFRIRMIGTGKLEETIRRQVAVEGLSDCVLLLGSMSPEEVRAHMEKSEIFLFTSDCNEGWGAVLNESMNSGCAVVASSAIGSVPFLLQDGENGLIYENAVDALYQKVKQLLDQPQLRQTMGIKAYETMTEQWNAPAAAERLLQLVEAMLREEENPVLFENGPCSKAEIFKD